VRSGLKESRTRMTPIVKFGTPQWNYRGERPIWYSRGGGRREGTWLNIGHTGLHTYLAPRRGLDSGPCGITNWKAGARSWLCFLAVLTA